VFKGQLNQKLAASGINPTEQQKIIVQQNKLGGIQIPENFSNQSKAAAQIAVEDSFIYGFQWAMGITAIFLHLSRSHLIFHNS